MFQIITRNTKPSAVGRFRREAANRQNEAANANDGGLPYGESTLQLIRRTVVIQVTG